MLNFDKEGYFKRRIINVEGIIFLGAPHKGAQIAQSRLRRLYGIPSQTLMDLEPNSRQLRDIAARFAGTIPNMHVKFLINAFETRQSSTKEFVQLPGVLSKINDLIDKNSFIPIVVPAASAQLELQEVLVISTNSCHRSLPRLDFPGAEDLYQAIRNAIQSQSNYSGSDPAGLKLLI